MKRRQFRICFPPLIDSDDIMHNRLSNLPGTADHQSNMAPAVHLTGPIAFISLFIATNLVFVVYLSPLLPFLDACTAFFDTACNNAEKWAMGWNWFFTASTLALLGTLTYLARFNDSKLRRLCTYVNYALFLQLGAYLFWGSKDSGGVFEDAPSRVSFVTCLVLLNMGSYELRSGPLCQARSNPLRPTTPSGICLFIHIIVLNALIVSFTFHGAQA